MAIARLTHLGISIPASGAPPGHVPADCFPGGAPRKNGLGSFRVSVADDVTMLGEVSPSVCSSVLEEPTPIVSAVVVDAVVIPEGETNGPSDVVQDVIPPPPGFPPFSWPIVIGHVTIEQSGSPFGDGGSPDVLASHPDVEPPFSPIAQAHDSESVCLPDVELLVSPLPTVEKLFMQDRLWTPVALPSPDVGDRRKTPVPRWRLAREGPFPVDPFIGGWMRFPEYVIPQFGLRCAFRGVRTCASSAVPRVDRGSVVRLPSGDGRRQVGGPSVA